MSVRTSDKSRKSATKPQGTFSHRLLIRASAGTGKTFQLSSRYIALLRESAPEKILASTFTRKAAGEILERILLRLARACVSPKSLKELGASIGDSSLTREECLQILQRLTQQLHRVRISTLDSFFAQLAGSHALELGLPSGWRILDPTEVDQLKEMALEQMLREGNQSELIQLMHMLDKGDSSRSVSGLMRQTVDDLYQVYLDSPAEAWDRFPNHQFLSQERRLELIEQIEAFPFGSARTQKAIKVACEAARQEQWDEFMGKGLMPKILTPERKYYSDVIPDALCDLYLQLYEHAQAVTSTTWRHQTRASWSLLHQYHQYLERLKQSAGGMEFGDITRCLAEKGGQQSHVDSAYRMDGAIEHLMLDEFQDTSRAQWQAIRRFAEQVCQGESRSFFCVGDVKQAIYGWRGGEAAIFDAICDQLPGLESQPLNLSYRSSPVIIETVNKVMTGLLEHDNLDDHRDLLYRWCREFPLQETSRHDLTGYACLVTGPEAPASDGEKPSSREKKDLFQKYCASYIADLARRHPKCSIGVLTRGNAAVGSLIFELGSLGIPASEEGGNPLTDSAGVQLILSLMKIADHPGDSVSAFHVARSPLGPILGFESHDDPFATNRFSLQLRRQLLQQGYGGVIHHLAMQLIPVCDRREHRRLMQLADLADRFDLLFPTLRPSEFVTYACSQRCEEPTDAQVRVMNIHQSKGLEFDIVVLPELHGLLIQPPRYVTRMNRPGDPPELVATYRGEEFFKAIGGELLIARQQTRDRMIQEALCVLYVALTRAARSLHMLIPFETSAKLPKSFAGLVRASLARDIPLKPETTLWEWGDRNWDQEACEPGTSASDHPPEIAIEKSAPVTLTFKPSESIRHAPRTSPSGLKKNEAKIPLKTLLTASDSGAARGTLFHRWLQELTWMDEFSLDADRLQRLGRRLTTSDQQLTAYLQQFRKTLEMPAVRALLSRESYRSRVAQLAASQGVSGAEIQLCVRNELPFIEHQKSGTIQQGIMDRVVVFEHDGRPLHAEVIDYKTDHVPENDGISKLVEFYRPQVAAYREAIARLLNLSPEKQVTVRLAFLSVDTVVDVD